MHNAQCASDGHVHKHRPATAHGAHSPRAPRKMDRWVSRRLTILDLRVWLTVWVPDPSQLIQMLFDLRLWGAYEPSVVLMTPFTDGDNVFTWMHIVSIDAGIGQDFTQRSLIAPVFVGSLYELL